MDDLVNKKVDEAIKKMADEQYARSKVDPTFRPFKAEGEEVTVTLTLTKNEWVVVYGSLEFISLNAPNGLEANQTYMDIEDGLIKAMKQIIKQTGISGLKHFDKE